MKAEIVCTGTELLLGEIVDTNTSFIAGQLAALGIDLYYASVAGDNHQRLTEVLKQARQRSDLIIMTGGLGPTRGDITREVISGLLGEPLAVHVDLKRALTEYFARGGMEMPENNLRQATLIPSATALPNLRGTAPGWWVERDGKTIIALPGPPSEMQAMWQSEVLPRLQKKAGAIILSRTVKTLGLSEAKVDQLAAPFLSGANPTLAIYAKPDGIHLRITAKATSIDEATRMVAGREADLRQIFKDYIWGIDDETLEGSVSQLLRDRKMTVAVAESITVGFLCQALASARGSLDYFCGGIVTRGDASAMRVLGVGDRIPGPQSAAEMARAVRERFAADIGVGLDGVNAPDEASAGTAFIAIAGQGGQALAATFRGRQHMLVRRATSQALFSLRTFLLSTKPER